MKLNRIKTQFFDRQAVMNATTRAERKVLSRFGAFVRTTARSSIRKRKKPAAPSQPPSSHTGLLKRNIFFAYESDRANVVIGPIRLNAKNTNAPETLEHGGAATVVRKGRRGKRTKRRVHIDARPFMGPAAEKERSKLPTLWANSIR
ncbi:MAG: hypothetical protein AB7O62_05485 [Pirellulales bacterium]